MSIRKTLLMATAVTSMILAGPAQSAHAATCGLDPTLGTNGILTVPDYTLDYGNAVTVDAQGRYVVAGTAPGGTLAVMRLLPTGEPDTSFGTYSGTAFVSHDAVYDSEAWDVALLADGRIALAGRAYWAVSGTSWGDIAVAVLNPDGSRDTTFGGGDGVSYLDLDAQNDVARSLDVDAQGRIVVGGSSGGFGASGAVLARLLPDGSLDPSFGTDGFVRPVLRDSVYGIDVLPDGRILAAGSWSGEFGMQPWLGRFLSDGTPDASFGQAGHVLPSVPGSWQDVTAGPRAPFSSAAPRAPTWSWPDTPKAVAPTARTAAVTARHSFRPTANGAPVRSRTDWQCSPTVAWSRRVAESEPVTPRV